MLITMSLLHPTNMTGCWSVSFHSRLCLLQFIPGPGMQVVIVLFFVFFPKLAEHKMLMHWNSSKKKMQLHSISFALNYGWLLLTSFWVLQINLS